jgi:cytochrome c-type biogenesis protein CcmH
MRNAFYVSLVPGTKWKGIRFTILLVLLCSGVAHAQETGEEISDDKVNRVAEELYCPVCENIPLEACETQACNDWRELIREKLAEGWSDQEIVDYFADVYGERVRTTPTTRDFSLAVWILPVVGVAVGVGYMAVLLRRWLARGASPESAPGPTAPGEVEAEDDYRARLEREIRERG